jgi:hypothetical protein
MVEGVSDVDGGEWAEGLGEEAGGEMVHGDGLDDGWGEVPEGEEAGGDFGMGCAEDFLFGFPFREVFVEDKILA